MSTSVGNIHPQGAHHGPVRRKQMHRTELLHEPPTAFIGFWDLRLRHYLDFKYLLIQRDICIPLGILKKWDGTKFCPLSKKKKKNCRSLPHIISGYVPRLEYHERCWPTVKSTLEVCLNYLPYWIQLMPWDSVNLFLNHIFRGVNNDFETNWFNKMLYSKVLGTGNVKNLYLI